MTSDSAHLVEEIVRRHPGVDDVCVVERSWNGERRHVAYLVPKSDYPEPGMLARRDELLRKWQRIWDVSYFATTPEDPLFNTTSWNNRYTRKPYSQEEMREWVDQTIARIASRSPKRVLEIGGGLGLLFFRLVAHCERYVVTDFSEQAVRYLNEHLPRVAPKGSVQVLRCAATELKDLQGERFDTAIMNSVVQYFPSLEYFLGVLEAVVERVTDGGTVFLGDLRSLPMLPLFHASIQLHQGEDGWSLATLRERIHEHMLEEYELILDPRLFDLLRARIPRIVGVDAQLKRARHRNEMSCYRYDVVLRIGSPSSVLEQGTASEPWDWRETTTLADLRSELLVKRPGPLLVRGVPNARVRSEALLLERLLSHEHQTLARVRASLQREWLDPEEVWSLGEALQMKTAIRTSQDRPECFDVAFGDAPLATVGAATSTQLTEYANKPLYGVFAAYVIPELRDDLADKASPAFTLVDHLPRLADGQVDHRALLRHLPAPTRSILVGDRPTLPPTPS